jgi:ankyrin repeat protein
MSPIVFAARWGNKTALELIFNELHVRSTKLKLHGSKKAEFVKNIKRQCEQACWEACEFGKSDAVDILLRRGGVDVNLCVGNERLLSWAAKNNRFSTVQLLVKHGARMENERDCGIVSVMYWGHTCGEKEERWILPGIVIQLLRFGCNVANGGIHACAL